MFSDIVGFTTMAEALDPETLIDVGTTGQYWVVVMSVPLLLFA